MWKASILFFLLCVNISSLKVLANEMHAHAFNPYSYGYDVEDNYGNKQWRQEKSHNPQEVHGSYGYRDKSGIYREVYYVADKNGFRANIKTNEPGLSGTKDPASVNYDTPNFYPSPAPVSSYAQASNYSPAPTVSVTERIKRRESQMNRPSFYVKYSNH